MLLSYRKLLYGLMLVFVGMGFILYPSYAQTRNQTKQMVKKQIIQLPATLNHIINNKKVNKKKRAEEAFAYIRNNVNLSLIGRIVIGPTWRTLSAKEKSDYTAIFEKWGEASIAARVSALSKTKLTFLAIKPSSKLGDYPDWYVHETAFAPDSSAPIDVVWRLRYDKSDKRYKIINLTVANVSLIITQRGEFTTYIAQNGKNAFLQMLNNQVAGQQQYFFSNLP